MNVFGAAAAAYAAMAAGVWAVAWSGAPWWGTLIALAVAGIFLPNATEGGD